MLKFFLLREIFPLLFMCNDLSPECFSFFLCIYSFVYLILTYYQTKYPKGCAYYFRLDAVLQYFIPVFYRSDTSQSSTPLNLNYGTVVG